MNTTTVKQQLQPAPRRLFIQELLVSSNTTNCARIMGTLVALSPPRFTLDDGTAALQITSNLPIKGAIGQTLDVVISRNLTNNTWHAQEIVWNVSPNNEALRNFELSYNGETKFGYPCDTITTEDIKRAVHCGGGVSLEDLCMVLDAPRERVETCLQELQLEGEIYCNRQGEYVPL